ncbi:MAG TPA: tripartite tricarboxylate transporter substrate-binding protein [Methyloceanibacter sp.]|jgi:tripartite-type tricarboxylate transporter receptor subunit TctC|nr:tripartite tricarboxylate transporter substrate-binding protein [Methyloceanibacter sp.]
MHPRLLRPALLLAALLLTCSTGRADPIEEFYRGRTVSFLVGEDVGGGYDSYSRLFASHVGRHIPGNPVVVTQNMPGAAGLTAANHLYARAPKDGSVIGMIDQGLYLDQMLGKPGIGFDFAKFAWIGRLLRVTGVLVSWHTSPVKTAADLKSHALIVSATGGSSRQNWLLLNGLTGAHLKIIGGYAGTANSALALERGEIEGMSFPWQVLATSQKRWLEEGKVNVLLQTVLDKHPALADVPRMVDLAPDADAERILRLFSSPYSIGRAVMAPPGLPDATVAALRRAFDATLADRDFQAAAAKAGLEIDALPGEQLQALIAGGGSLPPALIERVRRLVGVDSQAK